MKYNREDIFVIKYADDTALVACLQDVTNPSCSQHSSSTWLESSFLDLSVSTTKELRMGLGRLRASLQAGYHERAGRRTGHFQYLGAIIDSKFTFQTNL